MTTHILLKKKKQYALITSKYYLSLEQSEFQFRRFGHQILVPFGLEH